MMKYRPEIDGLRALAVIPVILFHAGFELFRGGFVGVDVFFVISGYLITTILIDDLENKRFSIINFYERRARRILPALFFVMLLCIPFAWMWMLPDALENFGQSLVSTSLFSNNILLMLTSADYWELKAVYKPLLHTWSLAVEEQYYIIFPIFLLFAWRLGKNRVFWIVVFIAVISLLFSEYGWRKDVAANFYFSPSRMWELLAGSIAAFIAHHKGVQKNNFLALVGLAAIIFSIFIYDEEIPFPSLYTIVPVFGVVLLVLYADKNTFAAKILSTKVFVGTGLISYSLYLWHQPILAFARIYQREPLSDTGTYATVLLTFLLAIFTWKFVESPFRNKARFSSARIFGLSSCMIIIFISIGLYLDRSNGAPSRMFTNDAYQRSSHEIKITKVERIAIEQVENHNVNNNHIFIMGDSFAQDIAYLLSYHKPTIKFTLLESKSAIETICDSELVYKIKRLNGSSIIFAYDEGFDVPCINTVIGSAEKKDIKVMFVGTKQFGSNMNWLSRLQLNERMSLCQAPTSKKVDVDLRDLDAIPQENYFSFFRTFSDTGCFPVTNSEGELLSSDRQHFTIAGVEYFANIFLRNHKIKSVLEKK